MGAKRLKYTQWETHAQMIQAVDMPLYWTTAIAVRSWAIHVTTFSNPTLKGPDHLLRLSVPAVLPHRHHTCRAPRLSCA